MRATRVTRERYESGQRYDDFRRQVGKHEGLWNGVYDHLTLSAVTLERLRGLPGARHILVLAEDSCGDAASLVPILARVVDAAPDALDLRVFRRSENLDIMDEYLSDGGRAIPVAVVYDEDMRELGWWGPRPAPAQALFRERFRQFKAGRLRDKATDVFRPVLRWYREDRGRHTIDEFLMLLERGGEPRV
jgi:hypothetical protein